MKVRIAKPPCIDCKRRNYTGNSYSVAGKGFLCEKCRAERERVEKIKNELGQ